MTANEIISKAELFTMNFVSVLSSKTEQSERKQVFFIENQDELKKYMGAVSKTIEALKSDNPSEDDAVLVQRAESVIAQLKSAIESFQEELTISSNIQEEDVAVALTEETISEAMKNNKTTQQITENMNAIAEQRKAMTQVPQFNYAMCCDGTINLISAQTKEELNLQINNIANQGQFKNIQIFEVHYVPVPVKKKTVLTV